MDGTCLDLLRCMCELSVPVWSSTCECYLFRSVVTYMWNIHSSPMQHMRMLSVKFNCVVYYLFPSVAVQTEAICLDLLWRVWVREVIRWHRRVPLRVFHLLHIGEFSRPALHGRWAGIAGPRCIEEVIAGMLGLVRLACCQYLAGEETPLHRPQTVPTMMR